MKYRKCIMLVVLGGISLGYAASARAQELDDITQDAMLRNARYCTQYFSRYERLNGIPKNLLMAISSNESGRYSDKAQMTLPWPWTINVDGKGYYFNTMHEAVTAARNAQLRGADNVDVGCMQISMKHHPDAFVSLTDAFSPEKNVAYGAKFLRAKYDEERSWKKAIAAYHSKTPSFGQKYYANIIRKWRNVLATIGGAFDIEPTSRVINVAAGERNRGGTGRTVAGLFDEKAAGASKRAKSGVASMKIIKVTTRSTPVNRPEVLVIRPASAEMPEPNVKVASKDMSNHKGYDFVMDIDTKPAAVVAEKATEEAEAEIAPAAASVQRVSNVKRGPNFIFAE